MTESKTTTTGWCYATAKMSNKELLKQRLRDGYEPFAVSVCWFTELVHFRRPTNDN